MQVATKQIYVTMETVQYQLLDWKV